MALACLLLLLLAPSGYQEDLAKWRANREAGLKAPDGWLTLVGLFWLPEGTSHVGSAEGSRVKLSRGPARAGAIHRTGDKLTWHPEGAAQTRVVEVNSSTDAIEISGLRLFAIKRGDMIGIRVKDNDGEARRNFTHLNWFPPREDWVVKARFIPQPKQLTFDAQAGGKQTMESPGYVEWERDGRKLRLTPVLEENQYWFVFRDTTAGRSTYGAARFLYADAAKDGVVTLDFNKAYNPPCVFTPYATCPLPPPENRLPLPVEAGEKMYGSH